MKKKKKNARRVGRRRLSLGLWWLVAMAHLVGCGGSAGEVWQRCRSLRRSGDHSMEVKGAMHRSINIDGWKVPPSLLVVAAVAAVVVTEGKLYD